jgi:hypothetical protein
VTATQSGAADPGLTGGRNVAFTAFTKSPYTRLHWGPSSSALPNASLNGSTTNTLPFLSQSGTQAIWQSTTSWTNPDTGTLHTGVPIRMRINLSGGITSWVAAGTVSGLDPTVGAVSANNTGPVNFTANVIFEADIPTDGGTGFIPINTIRIGGGLSRSSFTGAFYCVP